MAYTGKDRLLENRAGEQFCFREEKDVFVRADVGMGEDRMFSSTKREEQTAK